MEKSIFIAEGMSTPEEVKQALCGEIPSGHRLIALDYERDVKLLAEDLLGFLSRIYSGDSIDDVVRQLRELVVKYKLWSYRRVVFRLVCRPDSGVTAEQLDSLSTHFSRLPQVLDVCCGMDVCETQTENVRLLLLASTSCYYPSFREHAYGLLEHSGEILADRSLYMAAIGDCLFCSSTRSLLRLGGHIEWWSRHPDLARDPKGNLLLYVHNYGTRKADILTPEGRWIIGRELPELQWSRLLWGNLTHGEYDWNESLNESIMKYSQMNADGACTIEEVISRLGLDNKQND